MSHEIAKFRQDQKMVEFLKDNIKIDHTFTLSLIVKIPNSLVILDRQHNIVMCNSHALDLFESSNESDFAVKLPHFFPEFQADGSKSIEEYPKIIEKAFVEGSHNITWLSKSRFSGMLHFNITLTRIDGIQKSDGSTDQYVFVFFEDVTTYAEKINNERQFNSKLKAIVDSTPLTLSLLDKNYNNLLTNKQVLSVMGVSKEEEYLENFFDFSPEYQPNGKLSKELAKEQIDKVFQEGFNKFYWLHKTKTGEELPAEITMSKINYGDEDVAAGFLRDLREDFSRTVGDYEFENYFLNKVSDKTLLNYLSQLADEWFFVYNVKTSMIKYYGKHVSDNGSTNGMSIPIDAPLTRNLIHEDDVPLFYKLMDNMNKGVYEPIDIRFKKSNGLYNYFRFVYEAIFDTAGKPMHIIGKGLDVNENILLEEKSKIDLLTGCYNKISGELAIDEVLSDKRGSKYALFIIDIDNFKSINDNLGHFWGDKVLKDISRELKGIFRNDDIVVRIGGDEFVVFLKDENNIDLLSRKAKQILAAFSKTYSDEYKKFNISGSVGIAPSPSAGVTYTDLYKAADKALYQAKIQGKNQFVLYSDSLSSGTMQNTTKLENLKRVTSTYFDYDLISAIFEILYERNGDEMSVNTALQYISQKYKADKVFIYESFDKGLTYNNTYVYCLPGINKSEDIAKSRPSCAFSDLFKASISGIVYSNDLTSLVTTNEAQSFISSQGIKSYMHAQTDKNDHVPFFLGLADCNHKRIWSEKEINSIQYISKIISIIFQSKHLQEEVDTLTEYNKKHS